MGGIQSETMRHAKRKISIMRRKQLTNQNQPRNNIQYNQQMRTLQELLNVQKARKITHVNQTHKDT